MGSGFSEYQVQGPAAFHMGAVAAKMGEEVLVVAPGVLQGIGQDGEAVESAVLVDAGSEGDDIGCEPRVID